MIFCKNKFWANFDHNRNICLKKISKKNPKTVFYMNPKAIFKNHDSFMALVFVYKISLFDSISESI